MNGASTAKGGASGGPQLIGGEAPGGDEAVSEKKGVGERLRRLWASSGNANDLGRWRRVCM